MKTILVERDTLPEAWEESVIRCWNEGDRFKTQYDKPGDLESRDVTAMIVVNNPMKEPRIHRAFPGSLEDLEKYRNELVLGVHDYYMDDLNNPNRWEYTYHQRIFSNNQVEKCIEMLKKCPYTRRAKIEIWDIEKDLEINNEHPPCLQYLILRIENGKLNMNIHIRSNDAYKASGMNAWAFIDLQRMIAERLEVEVGKYIHIADSYHIYGSYFKDFEGFLKSVRDRKFENRVWETSFAIPMFIDGCDDLLREEKMPKNIKELVWKRKEELQLLYTS